MLVRMWSNRDIHSLQVEMQNDEATVKHCLMVCYKTKYYHTTKRAHSQVFTQEKWKHMFTQKYVQEVLVKLLFLITKN